MRHQSGTVAILQPASLQSANSILPSQSRAIHRAHDIHRSMEDQGARRRPLTLAVTALGSAWWRASTSSAPDLLDTHSKEKSIGHGARGCAPRAVAVARGVEILDLHTDDTHRAVQYSTVPIGAPHR